MKHVLAILALAACGPAWADEPVVIAWSSLDGSGARMSNEVVELYGLVGQPDAFGPMTLGDTELVHGYLVPAPPVCDCDFNRDGFLDFFDFAEFIDAFDRGARRADFNHDGFIDFFDFDSYLASFERGCSDR